MYMYVDDIFVCVLQKQKKHINKKNPLCGVGVEEIKYALPFRSF